MLLAGGFSGKFLLFPVLLLVINSSVHPRGPPCEASFGFDFFTIFKISADSDVYVSLCFCDSSDLALFTVCRTWSIC